MKDKVAWQVWRKAALPEVRLVVSRWTAARAGAIASLWPAGEPRLARYVAEMLNAQLHSVTRDGHAV